MNPLYEMLNSGNQNMLSQLQANPVQMLRNAGYNIPQELSNNPQAITMHLLQTGQISSPVMQTIQPMLNSLMGGCR